MAVRDRQHPERETLEEFVRQEVQGPDLVDALGVHPTGQITVRARPLLGTSAEGLQPGGPNGGSSSRGGQFNLGTWSNRRGAVHR